jgi:NTE family protein
MRHTFLGNPARRSKPVVGIALGSGAARGWAHIGVLRELGDRGIVPDIVVGASVGSVVAGAFASGKLDEFEQWISRLGRVDIIRLLDARMTGGGFLQGKRLMDAIEKRIGSPMIEELDVNFGCVATELGTGRETWLREGSLLDACRASIALPGLFAPFRHGDDSLLVDGGLVNPVPVSLARAMGADVVIAVNLNGDFVGHHFFVQGRSFDEAADAGGRTPSEREKQDSIFSRWTAQLKGGLGVRLDSYISSLQRKASPDPGLFDVIVGSIDIMQDRITRSRMAGEPPDVHITPRLSHIGLMDFDRADECMAEGRKAAARQASELDALAKSLQ